MVTDKNNNNHHHQHHPPEQWSNPRHKRPAILLVQIFQSPREPPGNDIFNISSSSSSSLISLPSIKYLDTDHICQIFMIHSKLTHKSMQHSHWFTITTAIIIIIIITTIITDIVTITVIIVITIIIIVTWIIPTSLAPSPMASVMCFLSSLTSRTISLFCDGDTRQQITTCKSTTKVDPNRGFRDRLINCILM